MNESFGQLVKKLTKQEISKVLLESTVQAGPFDGGCLILAEGMRQGLGEGEIVRLRSAHNAAEHYGLLLDGWFYDGDGGHCSAQAWMDTFRKNERYQAPLVLDYGIPENSDIPLDPEASSKIADSLKRRLPHDTLVVHDQFRSTKNSLGKRIHPVQAGIRNFWHWFGDSQTVRDGRPIVYFHGTSTDQDFWQFNTSGSGFYGPGAYFTESADHASGCAGPQMDECLLWDNTTSPAQTPSVYPVYVRALHPYDPIASERIIMRRSTLEEAGHDSIRTADMVTALYPEQVKSAIGNSGLFCTESLNLADYDLTIFEQRLEPAAGLAGAKFRSFTNRGPNVAQTMLDMDPGLVHERGEKGGMLLSYLAGYSWTQEFVNLAIQAGASVHAGDNMHRTALHCAAVEGQLEHLDILLEAGADINVKDARGWSPLRFALACHSGLAIVRKLLEKGAVIEELEGFSSLDQLVDDKWPADTAEIVKSLLFAYRTEDRLAGLLPEANPTRKRVVF